MPAVPGSDRLTLLSAVILDLPYNFHWIVPGEAARAAQAYAGFLPTFLRAHGIRSVVNLRGRNPDHIWWHYERRACERAGALHRDAKLNSRQLPTRAMLVELLDAFGTLPRPLLLKCSGGQDRTSFAAALYLLDEKGWGAMVEAEQQFAAWPYLHWPARQQRWLKLFAPFAKESSGGTPLRLWIANSYSAENFAGWLAARGEAQSFRCLYGLKQKS